MTKALEGEAARISHLNFLTDDELLRLIDFHGEHFLRWCQTREDPRISLIYHGQILWALLDECDRRGRSLSDLAVEYNRRFDIRQAWMQPHGNA